MARLLSILVALAEAGILGRRPRRLAKAGKKVYAAISPPRA